MDWSGNGTTNGGSVRLTSGGKLQLFNDVTDTQIGSDSAMTVAVDTWYALELSVLINTGATDTLEARVDGTSIASGTSLSLTDTLSDVARLRLGVLTSTTSFSVYFDDFAINADVGAQQLSWPTVDGTYGSTKNKIVAGLPISDSVVGSWTGGAGGTTNLFDAVDNAAPAGTASETDTTQIENAINGGGTNYVANMQDYTTAGVPSGATIAVLMGYCSHGEDATSGAKTGQYKAASNPSGTFKTFTFGGDGGALGTWPTNWKDTNFVEYSPSVTLGTSPTFELDKTDTGTTVASVCFMGYQVQYNEASATEDLLLQSRRTINQSRLISRASYH